MHLKGYLKTADQQSNILSVYVNTAQLVFYKVELACGSNSEFGAVYCLSNFTYICHLCYVYCICSTACSIVNLWNLMKYKALSLNTSKYTLKVTSFPTNTWTKRFQMYCVWTHLVCEIEVRVHLDHLPAAIAILIDSYEEAGVVLLPPLNIKVCCLRVTWNHIPVYTHEHKYICPFSFTNRAAQCGEFMRIEPCWASQGLYKVQ